MENISKNTKRYRNSKLENYKYKYNQEEKQNEFDLINDKIYDYKINSPLKEKENKEFSNGSRLDKNIRINKIENLANYHKTKNNNKRPLISNSLNPYYIENNNYNYDDDYNNGGNTYYTQLNSKANNNAPISSGNKNNHSIKISKYTKNSLSKNDSKKMSNIAKTFKMFSKGSTENNYYNSNNLNNIGKNIEYKNDLSSDKIKSNNTNTNTNSNIEYRTFKNNRNVRNFEIQTNYNKNKIYMKIGSGEGLFDEKSTNIYINKNKDLFPKTDIKYKYLNEEKKSKTPLKVNFRYSKNTTESNIDNNKINGGEKE